MNILVVMRGSVTFTDDLPTGIVGTVKACMPGGWIVCPLSPPLSKRALPVTCSAVPVFVDAATPVPASLCPDTPTSSPTPVTPVQRPVAAAATSGAGTWFRPALPLAPASPGQGSSDDELTPITPDPPVEVVSPRTPIFPPRPREPTPLAAVFSPRAPTAFAACDLPYTPNLPSPMEPVPAGFEPYTPISSPWARTATFASRLGNAVSTALFVARSPAPFFVWASPLRP